VKVEDGDDDIILITVLGEVDENIEKAMENFKKQYTMLLTTEEDLSKTIDGNLLKCLSKNKKVFEVL